MVGGGVLEADLFIEGIERELSSVVCAAQGGHIAPHHTGVRLAIKLTVPLPILLHNLQEHSTPTGPGVNVAQQKATPLNNGESEIRL